MDASVCSGGDLDYEVREESQSGERGESKLETIYNKMMWRGRRYDVPTIIERNAIEEHSFRILLSYDDRLTMMNNVSLILETNNDISYVHEEEQSAILHAGSPVM